MLLKKFSMQLVGESSKSLQCDMKVKTCGHLDDTFHSVPCFLRKPVNFQCSKQEHMSRAGVLW